MELAADGLRVIPAPFAADPLALHRLDPERYPFLLQSTAWGTPQGRYDLLFGWPGERLVLTAAGQLRAADGEGTGRFLDALDAAWQYEQDNRPGPVPCSGGWFLLLGYELAAEVEPSLRLPRDPALPVAIAVRVPVVLVRDRSARSAWIAAEPGHEAAARELLRDLKRAPAPGRADSPLLAGGVDEAAATDFLAAITAAQGYIRAGDVFQANLSREWRAQVPAGTSAAELYARLRLANPGPFAGLACIDDLAVISSSPERLVCRRGTRVETRPIAGTHPRTDRDADAPTRAALLRHPKERAEHVMLIDLERNDLGRVCAAGSVRVDEFMSLESYAHVHHIVSNVSGRLRPGVTPGQLIRAVFPGGTITGCPKVRCMEIIAELEERPRGFYTGAMGYLGRNGDLDLNILIRTMVLQGRHLSLAAGSGIVADSVAERELEETRAKAKGLLLALH